MSPRRRIDGRDSETGLQSKRWNPAARTVSRAGAAAPAPVGERDLSAILATYPQWRRDQGDPDPVAEREIFEREIARLHLPDGAAILEIGFGEGRFLDWARERGFRVGGAEVQAEYVESAERRGHRTWHGTIDDVAAASPAPYDAIVCFDVLEHLSDAEIVQFFLTANAVLKPGGVLLARFPNGGSPFGRLYQHGDATHQAALTASKVGQLAWPSGLRPIGAFNAARSLNHGKLFGIRPRMHFVAAACIEYVLGRVFFGVRIPMDGNLVVHLRTPMK